MDETTMLILMTGVCVFGCFLLFAKVKHSQLLREDTGRDDLNSDIQVMSQKAKVLSKIEAENPNSMFFGFAHVIFETETGERIKVAITDRSTYDDLIEGDFGILSTKGKAFVSFERVK